MITDEFVKSEMLAEAYIDTLDGIYHQLKSGRIDDGVNALKTVITAMEATLKIGEQYDMEPEEEHWATLSAAQIGD